MNASARNATPDNPIVAQNRTGDEKPQADRLTAAASLLIEWMLKSDVVPQVEQPDKQRRRDDR